jgi:ankyrin repeat protein
MTGKDILEDIPRSVRSQIVSELMSLARSEQVPIDVRGHAAMTVSECLSVGFSGVYDNSQMLFWLRQAAALGYRRAEIWYHRICDALGEDAGKEIPMVEGIDFDSSGDPAESFLIKRIHHHNSFVIERARQSLPLPGPDLLSTQNIKFSVRLFNYDTFDEINIMQLAAWFGADELLTKLLAVNNVETPSALGFNALHYACLGGNLSTLRLLLHAGVPALASSFHDITPCHFAIFFCSSDVVDAIALLVQHGAQVKSPSEGLLNWDMHGLALTGTVLQWAIATRNRPLVRSLLPYFAPIGRDYLHVAMARFFWEILEDLLPKFQPQGEELQALTRLQTLSNPYEHWIAHGLERGEAIRRTVQLWHEYDLIGFNEDGSSHLHTILSTIVAMDDFDLAKAVISVSSDSYIRHKQTLLYSTPPLGIALEKCGHNSAWRDTIDALASRYTVEELETPYGEQNSFMGNAISSDSVSGVQVLLKKGVNANACTSNLTPFTPLHHCLAMQASPEMVSLLVESGADMLAQETSLGLSPLEFIILGRSQWNHLELLLKHEYAEAVYVQALKISLHACLSELRHPQTHRMDMTNTFRYLLAKERFNKHVNSRDEAGITLIQEAAYWLHEGGVRLLLDAQADASIPFKQGSQEMFPLQIACAQARILGMIEIDHPSEFDSVSAERKSAAMKVASELLHWHTARGDDIFRGITELHLACRMGMTEQVSTLLQSGHSRQARGVWPGRAGEVIPEDLLSPLDEDFFICNEKLPIRTVLDIKRDAMSPENWPAHWPTQATTQDAFDTLLDQLSDSPESPSSDMSDI